MKKILKKNRGITLITLVITIIVLLILVGVTISMISGENGILNQAIKAKEVTIKSQALEAAQLAYMSSQKVNQGEKENTIISKAIEDLVEKQGYTIYTHSLDAQTIKNIKYMLNGGEIEETKIKRQNSMDIALSTEVETTNNYEYYIQIDKKYYLLTMNSNEVSIGDTEVDINGLKNGDEESVTEVISNNTSVATVVLNDEKTNITITGISVGETTITTRTNLGKTLSLKVIVTNEATGITISSTEGDSIEEGSTTTLTSTLSPIDASDSSITWTVGDSNIARLSNTKTTVTNGTASVVVTGLSKGTTTITAMSSSGITQTYDLTVERKILTLFYYDRSEDDSGKNERFEIKYKEGMTWQEWINSKYNEDSWTIDGDKIVSSKLVSIQYKDSVREINIVNASEVIQNNYGYIVYNSNLYKISLKEGEKLAVVHAGEMPSKIQLIIYKEGTIWEEWINSEYNNNGWTITGNNIKTSMMSDPGTSAEGNTIIDKSEVIQECIYIVVGKLLYK